MHELFSLENKAVVITGSSRGIGKGMAKRFSEFGAKLIISSRKLECLQRSGNGNNQRRRNSFF